MNVHVRCPVTNGTSIAAKVFPTVKQSLLFKENDYMQKNVTISLCMYFQDAIAQTGGWKIFSESYYSLYNTYLPFYQLSDGYIPDEINKEDIAFVLWTLSPMPHSTNRTNIHCKTRMIKTCWI